MSGAVNNIKIIGSIRFSLLITIDRFYKLFLTEGAFVNRRPEMIPPLFHTARTLSGSLRSPPSPRGEGFVRRYSFSTYACICSDDARKAVDRVLSQTAYLRRSPSLSFIPLPSIQPPPLRGTSFHRKEGVSTRAPSLGRGCRVQRGEVGFLFRRRSRLLFAFPIGKGVVSRKTVFSYRSLPHWGRGTAQRWIGCFRKQRT